MESIALVWLTVGDPSPLECLLEQAAWGETRSCAGKQFSEACGLAKTLHRRILSPEAFGPVTRPAILGAVLPKLGACLR
ncbi:hypothetical protein [Desulfitobacterium sp.]|uniref:hypothetical protein n=1 Tax=Desulfitobacterium sp. TaxID=49981 RepID=UPI002B5E4497|nr:hypothetical protein [Desulfitobacterium sp.]HVJ47786.1 hypothetical protein [Desulfitobacterium sp.]